MNILILGGSKFVGKNFVEYISYNNDYNLTLANRGITKTTDIIINRDEEKGCINLKDKKYDIIIDFSCYNLNQFKNTFKYLKFDKYIFISSSAVSGIPFTNVSPDMYEMAQYAYKKKECEEYIINNIEKYLIFRPCYIVGENDYTNRFYKKDGKYYWNNGLELTYYIESKNLARLIHDNIFFENSKIINPCG
jgi:hypothetical protein